jgi:hypothetical protein
MDCPLWLAGELVFGTIVIGALVDWPWTAQAAENKRSIKTSLINNLPQASSTSGTRGALSMSDSANTCSHFMASRLLP